MIIFDYKKISVYKCIFSYAIFSILFMGSVFAQTIEDTAGDIPSGVPDYMDITKIRFRQLGDGNTVNIDFYTSEAIPKGNQAGINATTIFEIYMDVDKDNTTGVVLEDIGYDYKLHINLYNWNGKSWIDGNVYWNFDNHGNAHSSNGFFVYGPNLTTHRFRWEFSLITLKWEQINWICRTYYQNHLADQVPNSGHSTVEIDTSVVTDIETINGEHVSITCPATYMETIGKYDVINAIDTGAEIESDLCGTEFHETLNIQFNPWLQGVNYCGNPVMMGSWSWRNEPPWFIILHELGHNYTLASMRFNQLYPGGGYISIEGDDWHFGTNFVEAWASMVAFYAMNEISANDTLYNLNSDCIENIENTFNTQKASFLAKLDIYESAPDFCTLYPDLTDAIFLRLADLFGYEIFPAFFKILQPPDQSWSLLNEIRPDVDYGWARTISMTVTCCAFSAAAGVDLRDTFIDLWDFPIYHSYYEEIEHQVEGIVTNVFEKQSVKPLAFRLFPNYPNPFNSKTMISYELSEPSGVKIKIFNVKGQLITSIHEGYKTAGYYKFVWDALNIPSGIYIYAIETDQGTRTKKLTILR